MKQGARNYCMMYRFPLVWAMALLFFGGQLLSAETTIRVEEAESAESYSDPQSKEHYFELQGDVSITLDDKKNGTLHKVTADYILFNRDTGVLSAKGNVVYELVRNDSSELFRGESLVFNTEDWSGTFFSGASSKEETVEEKSVTFFYSGRSIRRFSDGSVVLDDGVISSSGLEEPYYRIKAKRITIFRPGEWAVKDATLYLGRIPILPLPYFFMPGDTLFIHPNFGYNLTKGYFLQTTTYLRGQSKEEEESGLSFLEYLDGSSDSFRYERDGLFLTKVPSEENEETNNGYIKLVADYYTYLGLLTALQGEYEALGAWQKLFFYAGIAETREIDQSSYGYTTLIEDDGSYDVDWQEPMILGNSFPFRFRFDFSGERKLTKWFTLSMDLPLYSDPTVRSDFLPRKEGMQWKSFIDSDSVLEDESGDAEDEDEELNPSIEISSTDPLVLSKRGDITFTLDSLAIAAILASEDGSGTTLYPLGYYYPESFDLPNLSFSLTGSLFDTFSTSLQTSQGDSESDPSAEGGIALPGAWPGERDVANDVFDIEVEGNGAAPSSISEDADFSSSNSSLFQNSLGFSIKPSASQENVYNVTDYASAEDVSLDKDYTLTKLTGTAALNYKAAIWQDFFSFENKVLFSGTYQDHTIYSDELDSDYGEDADESATRYDVTNSFAATWKPFLASDLWNDSSVVYEGTSTVLAGRWEGDSDTSFNTIPLTWSEDSITNHLFTTSFVRKEVESSQSLSTTLQLPPKDLYVKPVLAVENNWMELSGKGIWTYTAHDWYSDYLIWELGITPFDWLTLSEKVDLGMDSDDHDLAASTVAFSFFDENIELSNALTWDFDDQEVDSYEGEVTLFPLYVDFLAKRAYDYELTNSGWEKQEDDWAFRPYSIETGLKFEFDPDPFWKRRIDLSLSLGSSWEMNLIRYSENEFTFDLSFKLSIAEFLDIEFSSVSSNTLTYQYFDTYSDDPLNIVSDLLDSFAFFDRSRREASNFNLESISIKAVHSMRDWDLNFVYSGSPELVDNDDGLSYYQWRPEFSIFLQWRPIPEIKKEVSYSDDEYDW
ncbi:LPS-assembly protein LptD [Sediminispirochaeta smaragdinae]|uniref:Organic solvent tolerance protein OstA n=1 Tax=Sediminispirochaeta smaragdinae (strain DSM 11293 / JCM 15392 / SEBR 4228) TaxID=573413 RepID=E1R3D4_SEDSS|nr:LPS-assembly protein LptD [Sediminispirochaeta smaragdinae]ADK81565.1 Organic solvent tolerance protein OstA [Sediminispirochaeta smaragdinae DSM 11293]